jgi:alpha/beta superfamily hydrolase
VIVPTPSLGAPLYVLESSRMALEDRPPHRLPPPPANPVRSPPVAVAGEVETRVEVRTDAGPRSLEARVHAPASAERAIVICHPHPLYGGSMHSPVPLAIAKLLGERATEARDTARDKVAWIRFNFRGVGASEGQYDKGRGEVDDALAAAAHLRAFVPSAKMSLCGHSFGSAMALLAAKRDAERDQPVDRVLLIAPSVRLFGLGDVHGPVAAHCTVFIGDKDELFDVESARTLAHDLGAEFRVFEGFDHHFLKSRRALAEAALPVLAPEVPAP